MVQKLGGVLPRSATFRVLTPNDSTFLALDLGGTNLYLFLSYIVVLSFYNSLGCRRVCQVELHGNKTFTLKQQKYRVSEALKTGEAAVLFGTLSQSSHLDQLI
jgi:hexokinase